MKNKLFTLTAALVSCTAITHAATIVPTGGSFATGDAAPEGNGGPTVISRLYDDAISTGSWNDGTNISWGQGSISATNPTAGMTFNFDMLYDFDSIDIYQNESGGWGARRVEVSISTDNITFSSATSYDLTSLTSVSSGASTERYTLDVSAFADAQYVKVELYDAVQWVMLSEVDFAGTAGIPEPSAALLGAFGLLALLRRRRA